MSTTIAPVSPNHLNIANVSFGELRTNKNNGSKSVSIRYSGQNLQVAIPRTKYPMGIGIRDNEKTGTSYTLSASMRGCDSYAKTPAGEDAGEFGKVYNFLRELEEAVVSLAVRNSPQWFGKARKEDTIRELIKPFMNPSADLVDGQWVPNGKYPPSFRMKVPVYDGRVSMEAVQVTRVSGSPTSVNKPLALTPENLAEHFPKYVDTKLVVAPSIYISGQGFGVTWRVLYAQIHPNERVTASQLFDTLDEEVPSEPVEMAEETEAEVPVAPAPSPVAAPAPADAPAKKSRRVPVA